METLILTDFAKDVKQGLSASNKFLSSKYFYDKKGSKLFQDIMHLEEYYPTDCEKEIFETYASDWKKYFCENEETFNLIEFGAGDGLKTKILLKSLLEQKTNFKYLPIDISADILEVLEKSLTQELPDLQIEGLAFEYFEALAHLKNQSELRQVVLFLGGNLGNFTHDNAVKFLNKVHNQLRKNDLLLIGLDLMKSPEVIVNAYSDSKGVTRDFNLNLLKRINQELGANFIIENFEHHASYDVVTGTCKSFLISQREQTVHVEALEESFTFDKWEAIHTENSQKYSLKEIELIAKKSKFEIVEHFFDKRGYFVDSLWRVK